MGQRAQASEDAGIADEDVEPAEALIEGWPERVDRLAIFQIEGNEARLAAVRLDLVVYGLERFLRPREQQHVRAFAGERTRRGTSDAARGAGDERDTILETQFVQPTSARNESCFCWGGPSRSRSRVGYSPVKQWSVNWGWSSSRPSYPMAL